MYIKNIAIQNFRNYELVNCSFNEKLNIFYGNNAQGKTNLLEAIFYIALGFSHRTKYESELLKHDAEYYVVKAILDNDDVIMIKKNSVGKKIITHNDIVIKQKDLIGEIKTVSFSPEDLTLIKGEPANRRRFLDLQISQTNKQYLDFLMKYNKIIKQRNSLLKEINLGNKKREVIEVWDELYCKVVTEILACRLKYIAILEKIAQKIQAEISSNKEKFQINYLLKNNNQEELISSDQIKECLQNKNFVWYREKIKNNLERDIIKGSTSIGIHRDDLVLKINGDNLRLFGSQGQQRSSILSLKLAEIMYIYDNGGSYPILLLDDVNSELDANRRKALLNFVSDKTQTFITTTEKSFIQEIASINYYKILNGSIILDNNG